MLKAVRLLQEIWPKMVMNRKSRFLMIVITHMKEDQVMKRLDKTIVMKMRV